MDHRLPTASHRLLRCAVLLLLGTLAAAPALAVPAAPGLHTIRQPDGTSFQARLWGDEWYSGHETADGYAIVEQATTGWWFYATEGKDGRLKATSLRPGLDAPAGIQRGLRGRPVEGRQPLAVGPVPNAVPSTGTGNVPVLLINFSDTTWTQTAASFNTLLFGTGNYSMADYYKEVSYNQFTVSAGPSGIGGWYTAPNTHAYYGAPTASSNDAHPAELAWEAAKAANLAGFNFAPYDQDGDCYVDNLVVVHQGGGQEVGGADPNNIWSHSWDLRGDPLVGAYTTSSTCSADPTKKVTVAKYTMQPELYGISTRISTMGVYAHEFGHALGLPDVYDTDGTSEGVGNWSLMAGGSWNRSGGDPGSRPAHLDPWSKWKLGWIQPRAITCSASVSLPSVETSSTGFYALLKGGVPWSNNGEYFLVENRQKETSTFDAGLPGAGLLIWHVDEAAANNRNECYPGGSLPCNSSRHYKVALVQADNQWHMEKDANRGDAGDPYPGTSNNTTFNGSSSPNSNIFAGTGDGGAASGVSVTSISASAATMTATLAAPGPCLTSFSPTAAGVGLPVTLSGSGFSGITSVQFNGTGAAFTVGSSTSISTTVPAGATSGLLSVATSLVKVYSSSAFTVVPAPTITSFTPTSGIAGTSVTITGTSFTGATQVRFNATNATSYTVNSATQITATVPAGATTGTIKVTTPGGTATSAASFTVIPVPTITSFAPTGGPTGIAVIITGTHFTGATQVRFNTTSATSYTVDSATQITATVPAGATTGTIKVTTPAGTGTSSSDFIVTAAPLATTYYTLSPCRVADTRSATSQNGPPSLGPRQTRTLTLAGTCGIPTGARALSVNVAALNAPNPGYLTVYPADVTRPTVATVNFAAGVARTNNAVVAGSADGNLRLTVYNGSDGTLDFVIDVSGYFE